MKRYYDAVLYTIMHYEYRDGQWVAFLSLPSGELFSGSGFTKFKAAESVVHNYKHAYKEEISKIKNMLKIGFADSVALACLRGSDISVIDRLRVDYTKAINYIEDIEC